MCVNKTGYTYSIVVLYIEVINLLCCDMKNYKYARFCTIFNNLSLITWWW